MATVNGRVSLERRHELVAAFRALPEQVRALVEREKEIAKLAKKLQQVQELHVLRTGLSYPVALEGALKLKEISYVPRRGHHRWRAEARTHSPAQQRVFPLFRDLHRQLDKDKMVSNVHEIVARDAPVLALVTEGDHSLDGTATDIFTMRWWKRCPR